MTANERHGNRRCLMNILYGLGVLAVGLATFVVLLPDAWARCYGAWLAGKYEPSLAFGLLAVFTAVLASAWVAAGVIIVRVAIPRRMDGKE